MMSWNYRVVKKETPRKEVYYEVCEVYYSSEGVPHAYSENRIFASEELDDLMWTHEAMKKAFEKPFLEVIDDKIVEIEVESVKDILLSERSD